MSKVEERYWQNWDKGEAAKNILPAAITQAIQNILKQLTFAAEVIETTAMFEPVKGYLHPLEGFSLCKLAELGPGSGEIVEIGSFMGRSTCFLAIGSKRARREKVTAIDHFRGSPEHQAGGSYECAEIVTEGSTFGTFRDNLVKMGLWDHVIPMQMSSREAASGWTRPIRLLFIDGDHSYENSRADFEAFRDFVIPGGIVCFHDINGWEGVTPFFQELMASGSGYELLFRARLLAAVTKMR